MEHPIAYSYLRFSSPLQALGDSERRQTRRAEAYAIEKGLNLDTSMKDLGLSAASGMHVEKGHLGVFLELVKAGRIKRGSYLIVEAVDRLSRQDPYIALEMIQEILKKEIIVITLDDRREYTRAGMIKDSSLLQKLLGKLELSHGESKRKSDLLTQSWLSKRQDAVNKKKPQTKLCPAWLKLADDRKAYEVIPERGLVVRRIIDLAIGGWGKDKIAKILNAEGVATFGDSNGWWSSYIAKILTNRALVGEFMPSRKSMTTDGKQEPTGEVITDYFPAVATQAEWAQIHAGKRLRRKSGGPKGKTVRNLLSGIAHCHHCGTVMTMNRSGVRNNDSLGCESARRDAGCKVKTTILYDELEARLISILPGLEEGKGLAIMPAMVDGQSEAISKLEHQIAVEAANIAKATARAKDFGDEFFAALNKRQTSLNNMRAELAELTKVKATRMPLDSDFWKAFHDALALVQSGDLDTRVRLQTLFKRIITDIRCNCTDGWSIHVNLLNHFLIRMNPGQVEVDIGFIEPGKKAA